MGTHPLRRWPPRPLHRRGKHGGGRGVFNVEVLTDSNEQTSLPRRRLGCDRACEEDARLRHARWRRWQWQFTGLRKSVGGWGGGGFLINAAVYDSRHRNGLPTVNSTPFDLKGDQTCAYRHRLAVAHQRPHPASAAAAALYLGRAAAATALVPCAAGGVPRWRRAGPPTHSGRPPSHSRRRPRPHRTPSGRCLPPWRPVSVRPIALATPRVSCPS